MAATFKRLVIYSTAALFALVVLIAAYLWWSSRIERFPGLAERVDAYYKAEIKKHWDETYQYRVPAFQQAVPIQKYLSEMEKDSEGWELRSFNLQYAVSDGRRIRVFTRFVETVPKGFVPTSNMSHSNLTATIDDSSLWENIDGVWYAWETGTRSHLSLNAGLVAPNSYAVERTPEKRPWRFAVTLMAGAAHCKR